MVDGEERATDLRPNDALAELFLGQGSTAARHRTSVPLSQALTLPRSVRFCNSGVAGSGRVVQPIMPSDLPVKVRPWELTVYPRSHIRRRFGVTRPCKLEWKRPRKEG